MVKLDSRKFDYLLILLSGHDFRKLSNHFFGLLDLRDNLQAHREKLHPAFHLAVGPTNSRNGLEASHGAKKPDDLHRGS